MARDSAIRYRFGRSIVFACDVLFRERGGVWGVFRNAGSWLEVEKNDKFYAEIRVRHLPIYHYLWPYIVRFN